MEINEITAETRIMLSTLHLSYKEAPLGGSLPNAFIIDMFGVAVVGIDVRDYTQVINKVDELYPTYRCCTITTLSNMITKKDEVVFDLMRSGYMRYIRVTYPNQFKNLMVEHGYGRKIINERLRVWDDRQQYKYLIEENKKALNQPASYLLSLEPDFFDFMPENINWR
jgi:hypothetical protein